MKKNYLFILSIFSYLGLSAQVLNPSFENWTTKQNQINVTGTATFQGITGNYEIDDPQFTYNEPVDWSSLNQISKTESFKNPSTNSSNVELIEENTDAVDGVKSIELRTELVKIEATVSAFGFTFDTSITNNAPALLVSGEFQIDENRFADELINQSSLTSLNPFTYDSTGQAIDFHPEHLSGSYKYTGVSGDSALILSGIIKDRVVIAYTILRLPSVNVWTDFELEYTYLSCEQPDTIITLISSSNLDVTFQNGAFTVNSTYTGIAGSTLLLDDLNLDTLDLSSFPPIAKNDSTEIFVGQIATKNVLLNDDFCGAAVSNPVILTNGTNGNAIVAANGDLEYTHNNGFIGDDEVVYYICNSLSLCDTATWYIKVGAVVPCVANDDYRSLNQDEAIVFDATFNDDDCGTTPNIYILPLNGVADVESNGDISYAPVTGYVGADSLTYVICSPIDANQCDTAIVYFDILSTGIREIPAAFISIAPNPAIDKTTVKLTGNYTSSTTSISVYNLLGNEIFNAKFNNSIQLNTKNYATGVYLIQLQNELGTAVRKLVIAK